MFQTLKVTIAANISVALTMSQALKHFTYSNSVTHHRRWHYYRPSYTGGNGGTMMLGNLSKVGQRTRIQTQGIWLRVTAPNHTTRYSNIQTQTNSAMALSHRKSEF